MAEKFGEKAFSTFQAARLCGVFHTTVINWVNKGKLQARLTPGGHRRIPLSELASFMKEHGMPLPPDIEDERRHVLVLDDEPVITRLLENGVAARKDRYVVRSADNPVEALVLIGQHMPDLLIMDLMMPVMDGFQVCRILKSSPATRDMKIVAMSGRRLAASQQEFLDKNVDRFLQKPFQLETLVSAVDHLLA